MRNHNSVQSLRTAARLGSTTRDLCSVATRCIAWSSQLGRTICVLLAALEISLSQAAEPGNVLDPVNLEKFAPTPAAPSPEPAVQLSPASPLSSPSEPVVEINGFRQMISRWQVTPIVQTKVVFDDNVFLRREKVADVYYRLSAGLAVGSGDFRDQVSSLGGYQQAYEDLQFANFEDRNYFYAAYKPSYTIFTEHGELNTLDHDASLGSQWRLGSFIIGTRVGVRTFSEGDAEVGDRVRQTLFNADLTVRYEFSDKTTLEGDFYYINHSFNSSARVNSTEWVNQDFFSYQVLPKTNLGIGATLGYLDVSRGADQTYEQVLGRAIYDTTHRLKFTSQGGVEFRQIGSDGAGSRESVSPVFSLGAEYSPFDGTQISLLAQRAVRNSVFYVGENVTTTGLNMVLAQRLFRKVTLNLGGGYEHNEFNRSSALAGISRTDDLFNLQISLGFHLTRWVGVTAGYTFRHDTSTQTDYTFDNNRASLQVDVLF